MANFQHPCLSITLRIRDATFPVAPWTFLLTLSISTAFLIANPNDWTMMFGATLVGQVLSIFNITLLFWLLFVLTVRLSIRWVLTYKGWLFDPMGKPSATTKAFMIFVKLLQKCKPTFHSYQGLIPSRPLPKVERTVELYLKSVKPLMSSQEYKETEELASDFLKNEGQEIQAKLWLKWLTSPNYVDDWWKQYAYLAGRDSLIYTNTGGTDTIFNKTTCNQAARTANLLCLWDKWFDAVGHDPSGQAITLAGIPLSSEQYYAVAQRVRRAKRDQDIDVAYERCNSTHAVVWYKNVFYKIDMFDPITGHRLRPYEIQKAIEEIMANPQQPDTPEEGRIGAITATDRDTAAMIREKYFADGLNAESIALIENSRQLMFMTDDDDEHYSKENPCTLDKWYKRSFGNDGYQLWCERTMYGFVSKNGKWYPNGDHSHADGLIPMHLIEYAKYHENLVPGYRYTEKGDCEDQKIDYQPKAQKINWHLCAEVRQEINKAAVGAKEIIDDVDVASLVFDEYGKNLMKNLQVSPDAFIQMALQLTYFKDQQSFGLTYESAMSRLFQQGRTETVRSLTEQSCNFVHTMLNESKSIEEKLQALKIACEEHQMQYKRAMAGDACDRHLFAMYIVSRGLEIKSPFLNKAMGGHKWHLSTSQTPQLQHPEFMKELSKHPELLFPAGGFTAPKDSNYGVCYTVCTSGNLLSFFITGWKHMQNTDAHRFRQCLLETLREMQALAM